MLVQMNKRGTITIPKELRRDLEGAGLFEAVRRDDGVIELQPRIAIDPSQAWFWTERWQKMEREADEDYAAGRSKTYDDLESFLAGLEEGAKRRKGARKRRSTSRADESAAE